MSWQGMDEAIAALDIDASDIDAALEATADVIAAELRETWPRKTGASAAAWQADGATVRNPRPETSHIRDGLARRRVPAVAEDAADTLEQHIARKLRGE